MFEQKNMFKDLKLFVAIVYIMHKVVSPLDFDDGFEYNPNLKQVENVKLFLWNILSEMQPGNNHLTFDTNE